MEERVYNITEFARLIGVSVKTLQRWDRQGKLKAGRTLSNRRYYTEKQRRQALSLERKENEH